MRVNMHCCIAAGIRSSTLVTLSRTKWQSREEKKRNRANGIWLLVRCINTVCDGSSAVKTDSVTTFMEDALKDVEAICTPLLCYLGIKQGPTASIYACLISV